MTNPRRLGAAVLAALLLTVGSACGTTEESKDTTTTTARSATTGTGSDECAGVTPADGPIEVEDDLGRTVKLDAAPERVAVLEWQQVEDALSLCVTPVAVADSKGYSTWVEAEPLPQGVKDVGKRGEVSLDALFATNPDLVIVEVSAADDPLIGQLSRYDVPVLATKGADVDDPIKKMLDTFRLIGEATGRSERAEVVVEEFETAVAEAKQDLESAKADGKEFVYFDGYLTGGNVVLRPFGQGSLVGELGEALGLKNAWTGEVDAAYGLGQTDIEGMVEVGEADLFHTSTVGGEEDDVVSELEKNTVFTSLPAVKEGRIHPFPAGIWTFGGPRSSIEVLKAYGDLLAK